MARNALLDLRQIYQCGCVCQEPKSDKFSVLLIYNHNINKWVTLLKCKVNIENYLQFVFFAFFVEICSVGLLFECCVFLHMKCTKTEKIISILKAAFPFWENICLPVLCKSSCSQIMLYQRTDLAFTPMVPFLHQFYPLTQQAKNPAGFTEMQVVKKSLYCCAAPGRTYSFMGHDGTRILYITFILAISYVLKKSIFTTAVSLSSYPQFRWTVIITCNTI